METSVAISGTAFWMRPLRLAVSDAKRHAAPRFMKKPAPEPSAAIPKMDSAASTSDLCFDTVYRTHVAEVLRYLRRGFSFRKGDGSRGVFRVHDAFEAEDVCHEAFSRFFRQCQRGAFDTERRVLPYLLRIAANVALSRGRKASREVLCEPQDIGITLPVDNEPAYLLAKFRAELAPDDEAVLQACLEEGLTQKAAGERLGVSRDRIYRSLARIRRSALKFFGAKGWFDAS